MAESSAGGGLSLSGGASGALSPSPELLAKGRAKERELIKGLRDFFEQKGGLEGWRLGMRQPGGALLGVCAQPPPLLPLLFWPCSLGIAVCASLTAACAST